MKKRITDAWGLRRTGNPHKPFAIEKVRPAPHDLSFNRVASTWWALHLAGHSPAIRRRTV